MSHKVIYVNFMTVYVTYVMQKQIFVDGHAIRRLGLHQPNQASLSTAELGDNTLGSVRLSVT